MSNSDLGVKKATVGLVALVCLSAAAILYFFVPDQDGLLAGFWRVGLVVSALWLAWPAKGEAFAGAKALPTLALAAVLVFVAFRGNGRQLLVLLPLLCAIGVVIVMLRPRPKRRHRS